MGVVVISIGRAGLVAACCLAHAVHRVTCVEINPNTLELMNSEVVPYHEPELECHKIKQSRKRQDSIHTVA